MSVRDEAIRKASFADCVDDCEMENREPCGSCFASANLSIDAFERFLESHGFKIVPVNPSQKMIEAGMWAADDSGHPEDIWVNMIYRAHGPGDVGDVVKVLSCSRCPAKQDLIESEPEMMSLSGAEGWTMVGGEEFCPKCAKAEK